MIKRPATPGQRTPRRARLAATASAVTAIAAVTASRSRTGVGGHRITTAHAPRLDIGAGLVLPAARDAADVRARYCVPGTAPARLLLSAAEEASDRVYQAPLAGSILRKMPLAEPISSTQNPRFRAALALREARDRRRTGRILIDGRREIERALEAGLRPVEAFVEPDRLGESWVEAQAARLKRDGVELVEVSPRLLERLSYGDRDTGLVLVAEAPSRTLDELSLLDAPLIGVIEGVEKPGNLGAILRTADGVGLSALLVADAGTDLFNANVIRASLGTVFAVPIAVGAAEAVRAWLRDRAIRIVAARVDAVHDHTESDLTGPVAIALGSEAQGLSPVWSGSDVTDVRVPMLGLGDSLNVSATAAILFYEALRQRRGARGATTGRGPAPGAAPAAGEGPLSPPGRRPARR